MGLLGRCGGKKNQNLEYAVKAKWLIGRQNKVIWKSGKKSGITLLAVLFLAAEVLRHWITCCSTSVRIAGMALPPSWMNLLWCLLYSSTAAPLHHFLCLLRWWVTKDRNSFLHSSLAAGSEWPLSLQIYFWFSYSIICVLLILSPIISQALAPFTCAVTVTAQGFPHSNILPCPEFLEGSCASFSLSPHSAILVSQYFHWISKAFEKPFSVICPAALLASPVLGVGDRNAAPEVFFGLILKESFKNSWQV